MGGGRVTMFIYLFFNVLQFFKNNFQKDLLITSNIFKSTQILQ